MDNAFSLLDKIGDGKVSLADSENDQAEFKWNLSEIKKGNKKDRSKEQKIHYKKLKCFTKQVTVLLNFFDNYFSMVFEVKLKATKGRGIKILTPEQMLQRLPRALAQVKAGNNSENLLNEFR